MQRSALARDRYALYEMAVQGVDTDLDFFERLYRARHRRAPRILREDFCATALLACSWAARDPRNRALGLDLDPATLAWCRRHRLSRLGEIARRVTLMRRDVRSVTRPRADMICALNFSYWVFKRPAELTRYFAAARRSLRPGGLLIVNAYGGMRTMRRLQERSRIPAAQAVDGGRVPGFTYVWHQARFNPVDHHLVAHIHFRFDDGRWMRRAFSYDWRFWTLPEIRESMFAAGFRTADVLLETWQDDRATPTFRLRRAFENQTSWLVYVVGGA
jgi:SAM-dependent methyltransferase